MASGNNNRANMDNQRSRHKATHPPKATEQSEKTSQENQDQPAQEYYPEFDNTKSNPGKKIESRR